MLKVKRLYYKAILPTVAHLGEDTAYDLATPHDVTIPAHDKLIIHLGIAIESEDIWTGADPFGDGIHFRVSHILKDRSSIGANTNLFTKAGVIDSGYRGELMVTMCNLGDEDYVFKAGERIAQMVPILTLTQEVKEVEELSETLRGSNRFGSSGK